MKNAVSLYDTVTDAEINREIMQITFDNGVNNPLPPHLVQKIKFLEKIKKNRNKNFLTIDIIGEKIDTSCICNDERELYYYSINQDGVYRPHSLVTEDELHDLTRDWISDQGFPSHSLDELDTDLMSPKQYAHRNFLLNLFDKL